MESYRPAFMARALELSRQALDTPGTEPFGAVVVKDGKILGEGLNHARAHFDPTSHGEIEAIRDACRNLNTVDLTGSELYTSCEPCALCVAAMELAGISALYYGASLDEANAALAAVPANARRNVDVVALREIAGASAMARAGPAYQAMAVEATEIIRAWAKRPPSR